MSIKKNSLQLLISDLKKEKADPMVSNVIDFVIKKSNNDNGDFGVDFTHYTDVEKEFRKICYVVEEHPEIQDLYEELHIALETFINSERLREVISNSSENRNPAVYTQVDSSSSVDFYMLMKRIIKLQVLVGSRLNPKYEAIANLVFEDFLKVLDYAISNEVEMLMSPVKVYRKEAK